MNCVIIGNGSIGKRHATNLKRLNVDVRTIDIDEIDNIDFILSDTNFDFGLVCSPTNLHLEHTLKLSEYGIDFFCEKPFFAKKDLEIINKIRKLVVDKSLINMIGCNLRFHPTISSFEYSKIYNIKVVFGYDLREWHGDGKYLESYSANENMGGGVMLDVIHEFDYLYHWFGKIKKIDGTKSRMGNVTVDTEDTVDATITFENGTIAEVHLDYLQPKYTRYFQVLVDDWGLIKYDIKPTNQMYVDELKYFIDCVRNKKTCMNNIDDAIYLIDKLKDIK